MLSIPFFCASVPLSISLYFLAIAVYRYFFHPLSKVPGPRLAAVTHLWLALTHRDGQTHRVAQSLHAKYGPVVRVSPEEVIVCSEEGLRTIYSIFSSHKASQTHGVNTGTGAGSHYDKAPWHQVAKPPVVANGAGDLDFFTETNRDKYKMQRRLIGPIYSTGSLEKHEDRLDSTVSRLVASLKRLDGKVIDVGEWLHMFILDALSDLTISKNQGFLEAGNDAGNKDQAANMWRYFVVIGALPSVFNLQKYIPKEYVTKAACRIFGLQNPQGMSMFRWAYMHMQKRLAASKVLAGTAPTSQKIPNFPIAKAAGMMGEKDQGSEFSDPNNDILGDLMALPAQRPDFLQPWVMRMALTTFGAAHDTINVALAASVFCIARNPATLARVRAELATLGSNPRYSEATKLPYLQACIKESIRLFPAIANSMSRVVPVGGVKLSGFYLPAGTIVGVVPTALHTDTSIFGPDAGEFNPDRWFGQTQGLDKKLLIFGGASRSCPGQNLAMFIMVKTLVAIFSGFDVQLENEEVKHVSYFSAHLEDCRASFAIRG